MYIMVNENKIIVASAKNMPNEVSCSKRGLKVYEIEDSEYSSEIIGKKLKDYSIIKND